MTALSARLFPSFIARLFKLSTAGRVCARDQSGSVGEPEGFARAKSQKRAPFDHQFPSSFAPIFAARDFSKNFCIGHAGFTGSFDQPEFVGEAHLLDAAGGGGGVGPEFYGAARGAVCGGGGGDGAAEEAREGQVAGGVRG